MKLLHTTAFILLGFFANAAGKPVKPKIQIPYATTESLIIFFKPDCPYCQNMNRVLEAETGFVNLLQANFSVQRVNIETEEGRALADKFNVHAVPAIIRFNAVSGDNSLIKGFPGTQKLAALLHLDYMAPAPSAPVIQDVQIIPADGVVITDPYLNAKVLVGCGDGVIQAGEQCDDGNQNNGDGCGSSCNIEQGYICTGTPSVCVNINANDDCANAIDLTGDMGTVYGDNTLATTTSPSLTACSVTEKDLWYKFTIPAGGRPAQFFLIGMTMTDPVLAVYTGSCGSFSLFACNDNYGTGNNSTIAIGGMGPGTYYVRVLSNSSTGPHYGSFKLVYNISGSICGDGIVALNEECDDGNVLDGDGCSYMCMFENAASIKGVAINRNGFRADPSSMLDVKSTDGGILVPRMNSSERTAIVSPATGLLVYDYNTWTFWYYSRFYGWTEISGATSTSFVVANNNLVALSTATTYTPTWPTVTFNQGSNFTITSYTVPRTGIYTFTATYNMNVTSAATAFTLTANILSGATVFASNTVINPLGVTGLVSVTVSGTMLLTASSFVITNLVKTTTSTLNVTSSKFTGYKVN